MTTTDTVARLDRVRRHKMMTVEVAKRLPALYATDGQGAEAVVQAKWFSPYTGWRWYALEFDGDDTLFGWVTSPQCEGEYGYFSLAEMGSAVVGGSVPAVERDLWWSPRPLGDVRSGAVV